MVFIAKMLKPQVHPLNVQPPKSMVNASHFHSRPESDLQLLLSFGTKLGTSDSYSEVLAYGNVASDFSFHSCIDFWTDSCRLLRLWLNLPAWN